MKSVAIACQGGGSHTAFTAGVLSGLLTSPKYGKEFQITALSGTSGGALCAGIVWSRLLATRGRPEKDAAESAAHALQDFWLDLSCDDNPFVAASRGAFDYMDSISNAVLTTGMRMNPFCEQDCRLVSRITASRMLELLERHIPLELLRGRALAKPTLRIGATNILKGYSEPIVVEDPKYDAGRNLHKILLASAAIPPLFQPVTLNGAYFWDGLYSHNPPTDCLTNLKPPPDQIWVIQINPDTRSKPPRSPAELIDRRNELTGNLSLAAELYHIDAMNWAIKHAPVLRDKWGYQPIELHVVGLEEELDFASKYDRSRVQMESLIEKGEKAAHKFFSEQSKWTNAAEGVHTAAVDPKLTNRTEIAHNGEAKEEAFAACLAACPFSGLCNTCPFIETMAEKAFDFAQENLEAPVS